LNEGVTHIRVSVINPTKKARKAKRKQSPKQKAASMRNLAKARRSKKAKSAGRSRPKKAKRKAKRKKAKKAKRTAKQRAASKRNIKKARRARKPKVGGKRRSKKARKSKRKRAKRVSMPKGKRVRPAMYRSSRKGRKSLKHSPKSRYAKKGYRFNPSLRGVQSSLARRSGKMANFGDIKRHPVTVLGGAVGGFLLSGYTAGQFRMVGKQMLGDNLGADVVSLVGNVVGTEVPAMAVHWVLPKMKLGKHVAPICGGMRLGGYVAMGLNAIISIGLRAVGVALPFRELYPGLAEPRDFILAGIGNIDLALKGLGNGFIQSSDYASLDNESMSLDDEINALSAYIDPNNQWAGLSNDSGQGP